MSDEAAARFEADTSTPEKTAGRSYTLTITLHPNGELELSGPLTNKVLSFGLLGAASSQLTAMHLVAEQTAAKQKTAAPSGNGMSNLLRKMNRG